MLTQNLASKIRTEKENIGTEKFVFQKVVLALKKLSLKNKTHFIIILHYVHVISGRFFTLSDFFTVTGFKFQLSVSILARRGLRGGARGTSFTYNHHCNERTSPIQQLSSCPLVLLSTVHFKASGITAKK